MPRYVSAPARVRQNSILAARLGESMRRLKDRDNITVRELSKRIGVSLNYTSQMLHGETNVTLAILEAICIEFDVTITSLIGDNLKRSRSEKQARKPQQTAA